MLLRWRGYRVRLTAVLDQKVCGYGQPARRGANHMAEISEAIVIRVGGNGGIEPNAIRSQKIGNARRMYTQRQDHGRRLGTVVGNFVARMNLHRKPLGPRLPITGWQKGSPLGAGSESTIYGILQSFGSSHRARAGHNPRASSSAGTAAR